MNNNSGRQIDSEVLDGTFSKYKKNNDKPNFDISKKKQSNKMVIESDSEDSHDDLFNAMNQRDKILIKSSNENQQFFNNISRKKVPETVIENNFSRQQLKYEMQIQPLFRKQLLTYNDLSEQIKFYLTQVYQFSHSRLFITGVMQNGQTINLVANQTYRELYFALRKEEFDTQQVSQEFMNKAKKEIDQRLKREGVNNIVMSEFQDKKYVFEIDGVCRERRPYYKVRYSFDNANVPGADWEGDYFKYVFGTTYTPLELFILNTKVKGPCWVKVDKSFLKQTKQSRNQINTGICLEIAIVESIEVIKDITKPPFLRVMSLSLKSAVPSQIQKKQLFPNTTRLDENHIYCISYTYCEQYQVELKPPKYNQIQKTLHLKSFGSFNEKNFEAFDTEVQMFGKFIADLCKLDPDVIVCHDASKILDSLIQRMAQIGDKNQRPKLGRLNHSYNLSSSNQHQRITSALAGRLIVDTFVHSKDMIKSVDYELQNMAKHIKPQKNFVGMSEQQIKVCLQSGKTVFVLKKIRDEADVAFALMNHLQVLQLTRNLSNICGNLWRRSLQNQRAQRNQFLIMHECVRQDLIIPDKFRNFKNDQQGEQPDRKKYTGGMVIEPKKGMYNDFIILLDFNSLYPSIIREYNVCFSKLDRPRIPLSKFYKSKKGNKQGKGENKVKSLEGKDNEKRDQNNDEDLELINPPPKEECVKQKWGFLPRLIDGIVNQRQKCKKAMKTATAQKCIILDIQQKSYKIVANSIYGCLGFSVSRFYSKPMAALITRMGRQALQRANDIVSSRGGVEVIYGDTDSLMIQPTSLSKQTDKQKLFQIKTLADELKKSINKQYTNLQIDIDGIFKPILLLMKKKYVANKLQNFDKIIFGIDQQLKFNLQFKGIEVVRRDGCEVSRISLKRILEILMNSNKDDVEEIYQEIYKFAAQLKDRLVTLSPKDFLFSKQLNKRPKEYANGQALPHVKVALDRVRNGEKEETLVNHTIYYLVCKPKLQSQDSLAKRCFDEKTYQRSIKFAKDVSQKLEIDLDYYKTQILQPWMRIFMHLQQFNVDKLFQAFDVKDADRKTIKKQISTEKDYVDNGLQDFLTNDMREKSKKFNQQISSIICSNCQNTINLSQDGQLTIKCKYCPVNNWKQITSIISNKISMWIKQKSAVYYNNRHRCECQKTFPVTLITKCCRYQGEKKTTIPFEIHTFVYLAKELIEVTVLKLQQKIISKEITNKDDQKIVQQTILRLESISKKLLNKFLENSDFENIHGIFDMFKV